MATDMSPEEIKKHLAALQSKMKPMGAPIQQAQTEQPKKQTPVKPKEVLPTPEQVIAGAGPPPFEPVIQQPEPVAQPAGPCFSTCFKDLLKALSPEYLGSNDGKLMLMDIIGAVPTCSGK